MTSSVFFRFKSSKEPERVAFDGTGISVFELKREIITLHKLGDGTTFELKLTTEDGNEEYDDDTTIIPRSTTVVAKRLPAAREGKGGAARYVSGKMPQSAKNFNRQETTAKSSSKPANGIANMGAAQTEEERVAAFMQMGADQWAQQKQEMANAAPVHRAGIYKGSRPVNVPEGTPPDSYMCFRCKIKGHWIQACPTNNDPTFDDTRRVKRTTGIPKSMLIKVDAPTIAANDGTVDDTKQQPGVMINAEGEWVIAKPDQASWDRYQAKTKVSAAAQEAAAKGSKELQDRGLECSIDKHLFVEPTKTPCCEKTFCNDCISNALLDNDLRCPECSTENILIDDLKPDEEMVVKIRKYEEEKAAEKARKENSKSPVVKAEPKEGSNSPSTLKASPSPTGSRKRRAESDLENTRMPPGPAQEMAKSSSSSGAQSNAQPSMSTHNANALTNQTFPFSNANLMMPNMDAMAFPNMNPFMAMSMGQMMGTNPAMTNPMMMMPNAFMGNNWNNNGNMWGNGFPQQGMNMNTGFQNGMMPNSGYNQYNPMGNMNGMGMNVNGMNGQGMGSFSNQQRTNFGGQTSNEDDGAYFRKPVNPHRHQARRNVQRPTDYREI
ncbi:protein MPE1, partial [Lecanoromycetidae sp. Uapishka_2]